MTATTDRLSKAGVLAMLDERAVRAVYEALGVDRFANAGPDNWLVRAPYRQDDHPSLSVRKRDGVFHDKSEGRGGSIFDAVIRTRTCGFGDALRFVAECAGQGRGTGDEGRGGGAAIQPPPHPAHHSLTRSLAHSQTPHTYPYRSADGTLLFEVVRERAADGGKTFSVRHPLPDGGWARGIGGRPKVLYRLPELAATAPGTPVYLVEGEKDADRLAALGLVATTNPFGAGSWQPEYSAALAGHHVTIVPDNDEPGQRHAAQVALALQGIAAEVRVLPLPGLSHGGDVSDWLDAGGTRDEFARLAADAPLRRFSDKGPVAVVTELADVAPEEVAWLWPGWLPRGKLTLLGGHPGDGKSTLTAAFAGILSRGASWPDGAPGSGPAGTLFLLAEDALGDTLRPRLDQHDADVTRIGAIEAIRNPDGSETMFSLAEHLPQLERRIVERDVALVVIDPLSAFLPSRNRNDDGEIRDLLTPLARLADRRNVAILGVMHVGKPGPARRTPLQMLMGSTAFGAIARTVLMVVPVPGTAGARKALAVVKNNIALFTQPLEWSRPADAPIEWHGPSAFDLDALFGGGGGSAPASRGESAEAFVVAALADGPRPSKEVFAEAAEEGISEITVRRACKALDLESRRVGVGRSAPWYIGLPGSDWNALGQRVFGELAREKQPARPPRLDDHPLDTHDDHLIDDHLIREKGEPAPAGGMAGEKRDTDAENGPPAGGSSSFAGQLAVDLPLDDHRIDDHRECLVGDHLVAPTPESAPAPAANHCIECGAPCGGARLCHDCARDGVPWRVCRACKQKLHTSDTQARSTGYCHRCRPLAPDDAPPASCRDCHAPLPDHAGVASGLCAECRALPWNEAG